MKLLIVNTSTGWGGLEMNVVKLAKELQQKGIQIHFICQENTVFEEQVSRDFQSIVRLNKVKKYFDFSNARRIAEYISKNKIKLVFTAFRPDLDLLLWVKRKEQGIKIIHQQQMQIGIPKKGVFQRMRYKAVDVWLTPLHWLKDEVLDKTTVSENKIKIVPLGVKTEPFLKPQPSREDAQHFFNFQSDCFVIGVIGRIDEKKGQLFLAKIVKQLVDEGEKVALLIVGKPTVNDPAGQVYYEKLTDFIATNQLEQYIFIRPFTNDVRFFYQAIDLFVMSSEGETFGMVTVEAMFAKKPIIGTNSSGTPEVLGNGERGGLYDFNDERSFKDAYLSIRKKINAGYDLDAIQHKAMELYSLEKEVGGVLEAMKLLQ